MRQTSHEIVWELDAAGDLQYLNDASLDILGAPPADLVGRSVFSVIHPEDVDRALEIFAGCVRRKVGWQGVRLRALRPDGGTPWVETSGVAHVGSAGELLGFTATTRRLDSDDVREASLSVVRQYVSALIRERRLRTVWQPIFSLDTGAVAGVEALTRFDGPSASPPDSWFADAFSVGLGTELELVALQEALAGADRLPGGVYLSLNLSPERWRPASCPTCCGCARSRWSGWSSSSPSTSPSTTTTR